MAKSVGAFTRDASGRYCFERSDVSDDEYPALVARIVDQFDLRPDSGLTVGPDQLFANYSRGPLVIGLDWDVWSGFIVTAHSPDSEPLVQAIGSFLSE